LPSGAPPQTGEDPVVLTKRGCGGQAPETMGRGSQLSTFSKEERSGGGKKEKEKIETSERRISAL